MQKYFQMTSAADHRWIPPWGWGVWKFLGSLWGGAKIFSENQGGYENIMQLIKLYSTPLPGIKNDHPLILKLIWSIVVPGILIPDIKSIQSHRAREMGKISMRNYERQMYVSFFTATFFRSLSDDILVAYLSLTRLWFCSFVGALWSGASPSVGILKYFIILVLGWPNQKLTKRLPKWQQLFPP